MSTVKKGDTVDIVIRGAEVRWVDEAGGRQQVGFYHHGAYQPDRAHVYTGSADIDVTVLEPPKPAFKDGDAVQSRHGNVAFRRNERWQWVLSGGAWTDDVTAAHLESGYYRPVRIAGEAVTTG